MTLSPDQLRRKLLFPILDRYERGALFGRQAPWPRDLILAWDVKSLPDAFAPDGNELLASLVATAEQLERQGCIRTVRHQRGPLRGEVKEIRLGPGELEFAYQMSESLGYFRLSKAFDCIGSAAAALSGPDFVSRYAAMVLTAVRHFDAAPLGIGRQRIKSEYPSICRALTAATALARGVEPAYERIVSERIFGNSKSLGRVRELVAFLLARMDPRWDGVESVSATDLLEAYGVRRKPALIQCAGSGSLHINGRIYDLADFIPVAHLPESWTLAFVEAATNCGLAVVTTIENEYPFLSYVESRGGPAALGKAGELAVYTGGFPTPALTSALVALAQRNPQAIFRHWGDADVGGLRILLYLRSRLGQPFWVFRTTPEWIVAECSEGTPLTRAERTSLRQIQSEISSLDGDDIPALLTLVEQLLRVGVKIEQEHFRETS